MTKKNIVEIGGKEFHVTPKGKVLPVPIGKDSSFQDCMSENLTSKMKTGKRLSAAAKAKNKELFAKAVKKCKKDKRKKVTKKPKAKDGKNAIPKKKTQKATKKA